jgi:hypothetical protein
MGWWGLFVLSIIVYLFFLAVWLAGLWADLKGLRNMSKQLNGLLWFDNDSKKTWQQRVKEGAERYQQRFFLRATICRVNGKTINPKLVIFDSGAFVGEVEGIQVYMDEATLPNHFYLYRDGAAPAQPVTQPAEAAAQLTLF